MAAVVAGGILFTLWFIGMAADLFPKILGDILGYLSLSLHLTELMRGLIDTRSIVYYLSLTVLFLFLAIRSLENSRWS